MPLKVRQAVAHAIDDARPILGKVTPFAQPAYSTTPSDRPFGLKKNEYERLRKQWPDVSRADLGPGATLTIEVMDEHAGLPLFRAVQKAVEKECPFVKFKTFTRREFGQRLAESDAMISPLGQSPADPLPNLGILARTRPGLSSVLRPNELASLASLEDSDEFTEQLLDLNRRIHASRLLVPLFHFPGIVASSKKYERVEGLSFNWGIQTWTYRPR